MNKVKNIIQLAITLVVSLWIAVFAGNKAVCSDCIFSVAEYIGTIIIMIVVFVIVGTFWLWLFERVSRIDETEAHDDN